VERQWKVLWESHSPLLVDPADVPSVLDTLMNHVINQLSPVELTLVQRRVRSLVKALPNTGNKSTMGRVFSSSPNLAEAEAKNAAQTQHLLTEHIVAHKFFRTNVVIGSTNVIQNTFTLLLYLSDSLWPRMAQVALHTAGASGLILDVNKQEKDWNAKMPKPSKVPDLQESPDLPQGVTLQALCCLLALARRPKYRQQRLQLLFYLCLDSAVLSNFLAKHPAGGAPCWLLEVGQAQVVSMASLTHYHYYGNAFTPLLADSTPTFIRSKSRAPLHVSAAAVQRVVANLLSGKTISTGLDLSSGSGATARRNSNSLPYKKNGASPTASTENGHKESEAAGASSQVPLEPDTHLMRALHADGERTEYSAFTDGPDGRLQSLSTKLAGAAKEASSEEWTLTDFALWADECLTETVLDTCFHNIFGKGLFPAPLLEKRLVQQEWLEWQTWTEQNMHAIRTDLEKGTIDVITESVRALLDINASQNGSNHHRPVSETALPWGNLGGLDGGGGLGRGMFYCVDKKWWDAWASYVGWTWQSQKPRPRKSVERPGLLSNEDLLEADPEIVTRGTMGSYEMMRPGLKRNRDYVLVPPGVWSILFELYSGGPPLPRMVIPSHRKMSESSVLTESNGTKSDAGKDDLDSVMEGIGSSVRVPKLLDSLSVETNPWVLQCSLCDPQQPYRRGDAGHMNIRIQAMPHQPLWRLLVETFTRFPLASLNAFDEGVCKGRLWKKMEASTTKDPVPRYGPWTLLCKNREARMPLLSESSGWRSKIEEYVTEWQGYADSSTVEESGLRDGSILMLEIAVLNKSNELIWPREAAAKAGRVKRLAEEDKLFRNTLLGLDKDGHMMLKPPKLVGMVVDAMDSTGRWHHATIVEVDVIDDDTEVEDDENEEGDGKTSEPVSHKKVKVSFKESDGHYSWIDVESDRLAKAGRFTSDTDSQSASPSNKGSTAASPKEGEAKTKGTSLAKKPSGADSSNHGAENIQVNPFPGFGACGLTNLGNTCYQNSAIQCMGYMPLLRSYLLSAQFKASGDLNKDNPLGTGGKLLEEFADLMRILWSAKLGEKSPSRFRSQLGKTNQQFSGADQQDAQEFLNYMLDVLHEDSNRVRKKPYVEALEDAWVQRMPLPRIGEEAWRRFLRRNQSIMANVGMGQVLNTVTCPVCNFSSRNFDPFNLLSITIPTVADVIFQVTVFRRASFANNAWILNKPDRRDDKRTQRFSRKSSKTVNGPPSETYVAEQYVIAMSRLADSSDLRIQIQNMCNIPGGRLKLCRAEEVIDEDAAPDSIFRRQIEMTPLTEKEGPCSHLARKKQPDEEIAAPTMILAFESTLRGRPLKKGKEEETAEDTADEEDDDAENGGARSFPTPEEEKEILRILETYGDARECRSYDSNPHLLAQALSRSIWPQSESELLLRKGLRVDAKDSRGNWYPGSVIDIIDTESTASDADTGKDVKIRKIKGVVHFDNFSPKWDEEYSISDFETGKVQPLYSHAKPKPRPTEFIVHHRHVNASTDEFVQFGQSFYVQCHNEWTTARAGVQILSQAARFVRRSLAPVDTDDLSDEVDEVLVDQLERCHLSLSALIDLLVECDKDFVSTALGVERNGGDAQVSFENPAFNPTHLVRRFEKNLAILLDRIPFEVFVATHDVSPGNAKSTKLVEEKPFPFSLMRTMSNCMHLRQTVVLRWRSPKRTSPSRSPLLLYSHPQVEVHKAGLEVLKMANKINKEKARRTRPGSSGVDLGVCLTEFCKVQRLSLEDNWRCPRCKDFREGLQNMNLWRLPDLLTFHIKRFNMSARWREKLTTKVNFPLTGLDLNEWCHKESPAIQVDGDDSHVYDLVGVMNHYGSMTGGHYVATCRATACGKDGKEEVAYDFNGYGASTIESKGNDTSTGWRLSRPKAETNFQKEAAQVTAQSAAESAEPLWLQFDDELVEPIPPRSVVSEMAYVLFYRRRRITPSNIARYSTLE
jgi:ubiquitin C-terminal hydrolase